jgi:6-phosphogluconate dehydrogenase
MVHNGIEYGIMAAYAEGMAVLQAANIGKQKGVADGDHPAAHLSIISTISTCPISPRSGAGAGDPSRLLDLSASALLGIRP